jgi:hypothetical protein
MKEIIIRKSWVGKLKLRGAAMKPWIFLNTDSNDTVLQHERIHIAQQTEMGRTGFLAIYILNYILNVFVYKIPVIAYRKILMEQEAKLNEEVPNYIQSREPFAWAKDHKVIKYIAVNIKWIIRFALIITAWKVFSVNIAYLYVILDLSRLAIKHANKRIK